jgi:hypothetical protein
MGVGGAFACTDTCLEKGPRRFLRLLRIDGKIESIHVNIHEYECCSINQAPQC